MSIYDVLLGAPTDQDRMAAMARRLRGQEALGTVAAFTGDPIMAPWGQQQMEQMPGRVEQIQRSVLPMATGNPEFYRQGMELKPYIGPEERQRRVAAQHARDIELKEKEAQAWRARKEYQAEQGALYMPEASWRKISPAVHQAEALAALVPEVESASDISQPWGDTVISGLQNVGLGAAANVLEPMWKSGKSRSLRSAISEVLNQLRNSLFGSALTAFEQAAFGKTDPLDPGVSKDVLVDRLKRTIEFIRGKAQESMGTRNPPRGVPLPVIMSPDWQSLWTPAMAGAGAPSVDIPAGLAVPGSAGATGAQVPPARPTGVSDDEWRRYLELEGF